MVLPSRKTKRSQQEKLVIAAAVIAATLVLAFVTLSGFLTSPILSIAADDVSASAIGRYDTTEVWKKHCQMRAEKYHTGDKAVYYVFADRTVQAYEFDGASTGQNKSRLCEVEKAKRDEIRLGDENRRIKPKLGLSEGDLLDLLTW